MRRLIRVSALSLAIALLTGCAAGKAFQKGEGRAKVGDWDAAVTYYRQATEADANKAEYRIALERAMLNASHVHDDNARQLEQKDQLDAALLEYRKAAEFDPANRQAAEKIVQLERTIRDRIEASRPRPQIAQFREQARAQAAAPLLNPRSREVLKWSFTQASLRDILTTISNAAGINIIFDTSFVDRQVTIDVTGSLEQVLNAVLTTNGLFYSVQDEQTIVIAQDTNPKRLQYERQVAMTFPISYADATELATILQQITRATTAAIPPIIQPNKTANSIVVRATQPVMDVIRTLIASNDKPRAEITMDLEILEVNRNHAKQYGLSLSAYAISGVFSPEQAPPGALGAPSGSTGLSDTRPFNLNTISQGVSTSDFYLALPQAIVRFLEQDTTTKILAKSQLRGAEGGQLIYNIGAREPYLTTTFSPIATGGANVNPLSSYSFEQVGISVTATPRVTDEGDILMAMALKVAALGPSRLVGGSPAPSFTNREVTANLRLRDGESHMLAGLLQDSERKSLKGFTGLVSLPIFRSLFSDNDNEIQQTDIVMLLTPRIIRTHEYTASDFSPIYLGTNQNFGLTGPPPLIAAPPENPTAPATPTAPGAPPPAQGIPPQGLPSPSVPQSGTPGLITTPGSAAAPTTLLPPPPPAATGQGPADPQRDVTAPPTQAPPPTQAAPTTPPPPTQAPPPAQATLATPAPTSAQVTLTAPTGEVRVASGPYTVPVFISGASRMSTVTVTVSFNPAVFRVRTIQEGSFLRQGATPVTFTNKIDSTVGRVDFTFVRTGDAVGASGSGLLAAIIFDAVGAGTSQLNVNGAATDPAGSPIPMQFMPVSVVVR